MAACLVGYSWPGMVCIRRRSTNQESRNLRMLESGCKGPEGAIKPFISLFMMIPVSGTISRLPNSRLIVVVREIANPV